MRGVKANLAAVSSVASKAQFGPPLDLHGGPPLTLSRLEALEPSKIRLAGPLYLQIAAHLKDRIQSGEWSRSQPLPNEIDLSDHYGVSLGTVRKALELLARQKLLVRHQGRGTFVSTAGAADSAASWLFRLDCDRIDQDGSPFLVSVQSITIGQAAPEDVALLGLGKGEAVARVACLIEQGGDPVSADTLIVPLAQNPRLEMIAQAQKPELLDIMEPIARKATQFTDRVTAAIADNATAPRLKVAVGSPVLVVDRSVRDMSGRAIVVIHRLVAQACAARYAVSLR